ncbi:hypothetical protein GCM10020295_01140 [Streptomyces cinereospinus]
MVNPNPQSAGSTPVGADDSDAAEPSWPLTTCQGWQRFATTDPPAPPQPENGLASLALAVDRTAAALPAGIQGGMVITMSTGESTHLKAAHTGTARLRAIETEPAWSSPAEEPGQGGGQNRGEGLGVGLGEVAVVAMDHGVADDDGADAGAGGAEPGGGVDDRYAGGARALRTAVWRVVSGFPSDRWFAQVCSCSEFSAAQSTASPFGQGVSSRAATWAPEAVRPRKVVSKPVVHCPRGGRRWGERGLRRRRRRRRPGPVAER